MPDASRALDIGAAILRTVTREVLDLVYPPRCPLCGAPGPSPCAPCASQFEPHDAGIEYMDSGPLGFRACLFMYRGRGAQAVQALKYSRRTSLATWMSRQLKTAADELDLEFDVVVPVPIHWSRRSSRGFNQAELLAEELGGRNDLLARIRKTRPQVGLTRDERLTNLADAFQASKSVVGMRVLLVDDVLTSGGTARECAKTLLAAGALEVGVLTFAGEPFNS